MKIFSKDNFTIMGFDKRDNEYLIRNPKTGELIYVPEKNNIRFKSSKNLKRLIND